MENKENPWISVVQYKLQKELEEQMLERWWLANWYGKEFTEEEWTEYSNKPKNEWKTNIDGK